MIEQAKSVKNKGGKNKEQSVAEEEQYESDNYYDPANINKVEDKKETPNEVRVNKNISIINN